MEIQFVGIIQFLIFYQVIAHDDVPCKAGRFFGILKISLMSEECGMTAAGLLVVYGLT